MKKHIFKFVAVLSLPFLMVSCEEGGLFDGDNLDADNLAAASAVMEEADAQAAFKSGGEPGLGDIGTDGNCPVLSWANPEGTFPNTLTIDYGDACECQDGRTKSGQIIVEMTDEIMTPGAVRTITLQDFSVNEHEVEGNRTVTNITSEGEDPTFSVVGSHSAEFCRGNTRSVEVDHIRVLIEGADTETREDDVYSVTGTETGIGRRGNSFEGTIMQPLIRSLDCRWISAGIHQIETEDGKIRTLDFGEGTCDDEAILTLPDGSTRTIHLRR